MRADEVLAEIGNVWGQEQQVTGPVLVLPYDKVVSRDTSGEAKLRRETALLLPDEQTIVGTVDVESRSISLFEANVYTAHMTITSKFLVPDLGIRAGYDAVYYHEALASLFLGDVRGLQGDLELLVADNPLKVQPGTGYGSKAKHGVHGLVPMGLEAGAVLTVTARFSLRGSGALHLWPAGEKSDISLSSRWPSPGFQGRFSPVSRDVTDSGFEATWQTLRLAQGIGQVIDSGHLPQEFVTVRFVDPVNRYSMAERSAKYGSLFVLMTFAVLYLFEVISGRRVHPVQYMLTGLSLCLFFLALLALAEHLPFGAAYALAATIIVLMVTTYARSVTQSRRWTAGVFCTLAALLAYLYGVLLLEDFALLAGTALILVAIAAAMWLTRRVDWYGDP